MYDPGLLAKRGHGARKIVLTAVNSRAYSVQAATPERMVAALHSEVDDLGVLLDHLEEVVVV